MNIEEFKKKINIISMEQSNVLRNKFINKFVDINNEYYDRIKTLSKFLDGYCYTGYLWECLKNYQIIKEKIILSNLVKNKKYFIMWDIHSSERILIPNYWKFGKENIIEIYGEIFKNNIDLFPKDIYIYDDTFNWTYILTHEYVKGKRLCLTVVL